MTPRKDSVRDDWDAAPCGTNDTKDLPELEQHLELEQMRDRREPFISEFARFDDSKGRKCSRSASAPARIICALPELGLAAMAST